MSERPIVDGFTYSASMLYLPTTYRVLALAQMEVLRRANSYRARQWCCPSSLQDPIAAYDQNEYQIQVTAGSYLWGLTFTAPSTLNEELENAASYAHIQITDACTETPLFSDYVRGEILQPSTANTARNPLVLAQPLLIGEPGLLNVEIYNRADQELNCQLVLFFAEPKVTPQNITDELVRMGVMQRQRIV